VRQSNRKWMLRMVTRRRMVSGNKKPDSSPLRGEGFHALTNAPGLRKNQAKGLDTVRETTFLRAAASSGGGQGTIRVEERHHRAQFFRPIARSVALMWALRRPEFGKTF